MSEDLEDLEQAIAREASFELIFKSHRKLYRDLYQNCKYYQDMKCTSQNNCMFKFKSYCCNPFKHEAERQGKSVIVKSYRRRLPRR